MGGRPACRSRDFSFPSCSFLSTCCFIWGMPIGRMERKWDEKEKESRGADRPAPHPTPPPLHPSTSPGGLERQGGGLGGTSSASRLPPVADLFFLCEMSPVGGANGAARSILTVTHTKTLPHSCVFAGWPF